ncbi:YkvA family protein [Alkalibacterium sp.]|uniref:YkvA family protein n=1 Tax=Alkalibacterium sp. TaxID=1872447 RepID=UPI0039707182
MKLHKKQRKTPMTQIKTLILSLFDAKVDTRRKLMVLGIVLYIISPIDLIPDFIPMVGYADDVILPILLLIAEKLLSGDTDSEPVKVRKEAEKVD